MTACGSSDVVRLLIIPSMNFPRVCSVRYVRRRTAGIYRRYYRYRALRYVRYDTNTGIGHFGKFGTIWIPVPPVPIQTFIPVPDTSVSSVRHQYRYRTLRKGRYSINTSTRHFGNFGTTSIPVSNTSVSWVRHQYRYRILRYVRYINTGTGYFDKLGTTSIPVTLVPV